ncbi:hypothetical protein TTHERM_00790690 (macronuclear) [Tetrahymena thermophila SB210]|uniref:Uncharacterized protein n=1 Tax=Tetrahymena thermophila (strain SB210) TaxID=312017 RepID=Q24DR8_TETTS|nr:hypothetical protein TTHERM_00790690 [Tetrahymena thermophila SB210]EAS05922.2 hypothetical protein TTHERM_00790690 [Tetrahymena thermophila SB210]|eukprot:XP_001026167.2 hypothetical protein TTHERM_00790690 [Tetrahymena thermophila SB210]
MYFIKILQYIINTIKQYIKIKIINNLNYNNQLIIKYYFKKINKQFRFYRSKINQLITSSTQIAKKILLKMNYQAHAKGGNQQIHSPRYQQQLTQKKQPEYIQWSIETAKNEHINQNAKVLPATPKKENSKKRIEQRSQSQQPQRLSLQKENQINNAQILSPSQLNSALSLRSPQSQVSTYHQSLPSNQKKSSSLQRNHYQEKMEKEYQQKNYDNVKKYLDLAKINRRVTANDVKKLAANPLSGINTNLKQALTMEGVYKRIIKETEFKYYDHTSQINLPISCAREEEHPHEILKQITPTTRSMNNGNHASQMKHYLDDASQIINLPGSIQRVVPNSATSRDKQVDRFLLPSALSDEIAKANPNIRYIYEERGKKQFEGYKNNNQFHVSVQYLPSYPVNEKQPNYLAYKKNASTLRIF